jgi:hypothetical protein
VELAWAGPDRLDLHSVTISGLPVEALDEVLAGARFSSASEDDLLERLLNRSHDLCIVGFRGDFGLSHFCPAESSLRDDHSNSDLEKLLFRFG